MLKKFLINNLDKKKLSKFTIMKRRLENRFVFNNKNNESLSYKILIGTHHKTGTVWFANVFKDIASYFYLLYITENLKDNLNYSEYDIILNHHSEFDFSKLKKINYRGIHVIRDPRDIIISSTFYHQKSQEPWLHVPQKRFGGMTYQEKINSFSSFEEKAIFEMNNSSGNNIMEIKKWDYSNNNFLEIKYEDIIQDYSLQIFHDIFDFLGFSGKFIPDLLKISWENSLFSGKVSSEHIRSGDTKQFKKYFNSKLKNVFLNKFDDLLIKLSYEKDDDW